MKILIVVPDLAVGGVTTVVLNMIGGLQKKGCEILLISLKEESSCLKGVYMVSLGIQNFKDYILSIKKVKKIIDQFKPDIIHSHTYYSHMLIRLFTLFFGKEAIHIVSEHGTFIKNKKSLSWFLFRITKSFSNFFINVSKKSLDSYIKNNFFIEENSIVLYNGIDIDKFRKNEIDKKNIYSQYQLDKVEFVLGYVGRFAEEKDVANLLYAVELINFEKVNFKLFLIGDGPCKNELISIVHELGLDDKIIFTGMQENVHKYISAFDILVLPSKTEGLPTVILEAMAMECLIVSTDCGGVREILSGLPSFICETGSSVKLANQINCALTLTMEEKKNYTKIYRERIINKFSIDVMNTNLYSIYKKLLNI